MKVLLINSNMLKPPITPLGLIYIARAAMDAGHDVKIMDLNFSVDIKNDISEIVRDFSPDVIGTSIRNIDNVTMLHSVFYIPEIKKIINLLKEYSDAPIILGGPGFSIMPKEIMSELDVSYGVYGEGENAIVELLQCIKDGKKPAGIHNVIYRDGDALIVNKYRNMPSEELDRRPLPARELIDNLRYLNDGGMGNIQTRRGCDKKCLYCTYPVIEGRNIRFRSPEKIVDEIEMLKDIGIDYLHFADSAMNIPEDHAVFICNEMLKRKVTIKYTPYVYPWSPSRELMYLAKKTGCDGIVFGVDTISEKMLVNMRKGFSVDDVKQYAKFCKEVELPFSLNLLFGGPGETKETVKETLDNLNRIKPVAVGAMIGIRVFPYTALWKIACNEGLITKEQNILEPFYYVSPTIDRDWLIDTIMEYNSTHDNFFMPTSKEGLHTDNMVIEIFRDGIRGPFWEIYKELKRRIEAQR